MAGIAVIINNEKMTKYHNVGMCPRCKGRAGFTPYFGKHVDQCLMCGRFLEWTGYKYLIADIGRQLEVEG